MLALIILIVFGLGTAYFATQNTGVVHITIGNYLIQRIPIYVIVVGSILLGIFISWLISIVDSISSRITIYGKDSAIKEAYKTIETLKEENHNLEVENARLRGIPDNSEDTEVIEKKDVKVRPSFFQTLKHSFG